MMIFYNKSPTLPAIYSNLKKLGKRIVEIRKEKGISQAELARLCFKDPQSIERLENGKVNPSIYYLQEIANGLGVDIKKFL